MYCDLYSNLVINRKLISVLGLNKAAYIAALSDICTHVVRKATADAAGFFPIERKYVTELTGLSLEEQLTCDLSLQKISLLEVSESDVNKIRIDVAAITSLIVETDTTVLKKISAKAKTTKTAEKAAKKTANVMTTDERAEKAKNKKAGLVMGRQLAARNIVNNSALDTVYDEWVKTVYEGGRYLTDADIKRFTDTVSTATSDIQTHIAIVNIAITNHWINAEWAVNSYNRSKPMARSIPATHIEVEQKISKGLNEDVIF